MACSVELSQAERQRRRRLNGLPEETAGASVRWFRRRGFRIGMFAAVIYALSLFAQWWTFRPRLVNGHIAGFTWEAVVVSTRYASWTVLGWCVLVFLLDRWRPQRPLVWGLALGWGAAISTLISLHINTWAAQHLGSAGEEAAVGARAAIFVAPFVEEAAKASVLFLVAILVRYRLVSKLSVVSLAVLSAAGFAFTENIIYYGRAYMFASQQIGAGDRDVAVAQLALMRGLLTCWGHPMFTSLTGIGLAIALRTRSRTVRVLAPVAGYLFAALSHMYFNTMASTIKTEADLKQFLYLGIAFIVSALGFAIMNWMAQGRLIRARLMDFVAMGWLPESDIKPLATWRGRIRVIWASLAFGWATFIATIRLIRAETELAYLRDAVTRGIVDDTAYLRERELFANIRALRLVAITDTKAIAKPGIVNSLRAWVGLPAREPKKALTPVSVQQWQAVMPAVAPVSGQTRYSQVDPTWGPPST